MPPGSIPTGDSITMLRETKPENLHNPVSISETSVIAGKTCYDYYCIMCHGKNADGNGTVGQSFYPLPANLSSPYVQQQSDGQLFYTISLGFKRHPPLAYTIAEADRWQIINYIRSLSEISTG
jgi:mono/diheme cytochrome c family protein